MCGNIYILNLTTTGNQMIHSIEILNKMAINISYFNILISYLVG